MQKSVKLALQVCGRLLQMLETATFISCQLDPPVIAWLWGKPSSRCLHQNLEPKNQP
jgi:hypothetical protein